MRIGINAFPLRANGGGARYVFAGLLSALLKVDSSHRYIIFAHQESRGLIDQILKSHDNANSRTDTAPRVKIIQVTDERQMLSQGNDFDLLFGPLNNLNPRLYDRPSVVILHDIQEQYFPQYFSKSELIGRQEVYPEMCRAATTVIAISQFCKNSFVEKFGVDPQKIEVVPNAPQADVVDAAEDGAWTRSPLPPRFLFYPANCYLHKNHAMLLDAVTAMKDEGLPIVFSGYELAGGFPLRKEIADRGLGERCMVFTDLPADELRYLYRHALAVVLPTKFEGFGMPAIEAAACGCPVVCSDLPAFREVLGDNALYFDPDSLDDICRKIRRIVDDCELREVLISAGLELSRTFTWDASARQVLGIFDKAQERFVWGKHRPHSVERPRIGVSIRLNHGGNRVIPTIQSLLAAGYLNLILRCQLPGSVPQEVQSFLKASGVQVIDDNGVADRDGYASLREFAKEQNLDLVGEIVEGHRFKASAMDSIARGYLAEPNTPVHLGESMEWRGKKLVGTSRLRVLGDGNWRFERHLHRELICINPRALDAWPEGLNLAIEGGDQWRWKLVCEARRNGRLFVSRRTLADTDQLIVGKRALRRAIKAGMSDVYSADGQRIVKSGLLGRVEPTIKLAAAMLPHKWQDAGTRLWYRIQTR